MPKGLEFNAYRLVQMVRLGPDYRDSNFLDKRP